MRASRRLRAGASRRAVMRQVRRDYFAVEERFEEAGDTVVCERFAVEMNRWLRAAGYRLIEAADEFSF